MKEEYEGGGYRTVAKTMRASSIASFLSFVFTRIRQKTMREAIAASTKLIASPTGALEGGLRSVGFCTSE